MVNIFNLFITYGDTFLPNANSYDELYYEIIRVHQVFDNLYSMSESSPCHQGFSVIVMLIWKMITLNKKSVSFSLIV